jgi:hypothetical protein
VTFRTGVGTGILAGTEAMDAPDDRTLTPHRLRGLRRCGVRPGRLSPMVTREFSAALEAAARAERCAHRKHQGTEPPLVQGDLFSSLFEQASGVLGINEVSNDGKAAEYTLDFEYRTPGDPGQVSKWHDGVQLVLIDGAWLIDDFIHRGDWQFTSQGSVKSMLTATAGLCAER